MPKKEKTILNSYLRRLTNLSSNNRSIYLPRVGSDQFIDLHTLSQLNGEKSFSIIEALIAHKSKTICPLVDSRMETSNEASKKIKRLQRADEMIFEESGSKDLHIGWPFARGKFLDGTLIRCPLLFFPVTLVQENKCWSVKPREDGDVSFNKSFLLAYSYYNKIKIEDFLLEETFEEFSHDSTVFRTALYQLLQKSTLDIHFNPDNYKDELDFFKTYTKEELEKEQGEGMIKLYPEAVLGIFPQTGSYLVPDYVELIESQHIETMEEFFLEKNQAEQQSLLFSNFIPLVKEQKLFTAYAQDAWQENIMKAIKTGYSVVVQGPPGTGKSQLICNLLADALATGKKVLVVCQKRAALDVVHTRLKHLNLGDFLALVHDFKNDRKAIYAKAAALIERVNEFKIKNNSLDAIQLDRKFLQISHRIDQITEELEEFKKNLFNNTECGVSVKELYLQSNPHQPTINLKQEYQNFPMDSLPSFLVKLNAIAHYAERFGKDDYPLRQRKSFSGLGITDLKAMGETLEEIKLTTGKLLTQLKTEIGAQLDWEQCNELLEMKEQIDTMCALIENDNTYHYFRSIVEETEETPSTLWLANIERIALECFDGDGPETIVASAQLGVFQKALYRSMKARKSLIGLVRWELFSKDKFLIKRAIVGNGLESSKEGFKRLERKLDQRLNLEHNLSKLRVKSWLKNVPEKYDRSLIQEWFTDQKNAIQAKDIFKSVRGITNFIDLAKLSHSEMERKIRQLFSLLSPILILKQKWNIYFSQNQVNELANHPNLVETLQVILNRDFDALCEFDTLRDHLLPHEKSCILKLQEVASSPEELASLFKNSLCLAWIDHIETKFPALRMVSSGKLHLLEAELHELVSEKQKISNDIIQLRAREQITNDLEFNRLNNRVTYRDLLHQLTKKKRIWPLRKVLSEYESEIFRLLPCWLTSPESVSAIFPLRQIFDLVIFDEASQCYAEQGIPAMFRGKQLVVAGDDKQLKPNDLYRVRWQNDEEENPDAEVTSLLDLSKRYLMQLTLKSHYRSQSLELIDFSNRYFYDGQLTLLPHAENYQSAEPPVQYLHVDGQWENNTNSIEAQEVVELAFKLVKKNPKKEIGIVTFNAPQQLFILDLLEERFSASKLPIPETLIVKNIENVQGDEKDIILFSMGYAPDKTGKMNAQFGSLNVEGGENRLNVAITRAREKIIVVTSIWPDQLRVEDTRNEGPKLLKKYLQYIKAVAEGKFLPYVREELRSDSQLYLKDIIHTWGEKKFPQGKLAKDELPFADVSALLGAKHKGLIMTDDELYRQNPSVKDLHASLPAVLENKNWKYLRTYSRNYWQDLDKFFNEIAKFISN